MSQNDGISRRDFLKTSSGIVITAAGGILGFPSVRHARAQVPAGEFTQENILHWDLGSVPEPDFWFIVLSDTHVTAHPEPWITEDLFLPAGARQRWQDVHQMNIGRFIKVIEQANASKPDLVMHLGDITTSHPQRPSWDKECLNARKLIGTIDVPVHLCPGNHDVGNKLSLSLPNWPANAGDPRKSFHVSDDNIALYKQYFGEPYYSFDHKGCHFIVLLEHVFGSGWQVEKEEWEWLEADLAAHQDARHVFMFFHTPIYWVDPVRDVGPENYEIIDEEPRARLLELIDKYRARAVFTGHTHHNITNQYERTGLFTVTSTAFARNSWALYPDVGGGNRDPAHAGYLIVRVYGDSAVVNFVRTVDRTPPAGPLQEQTAYVPKRLLTQRSEDRPRMPFVVSAPLPYVVPRMWGPENAIDGRLKDPDGRSIQYAAWTSNPVPAEDANEWIRIDFEKPATLTKIVLVGRGSAFPVDFHIEARNGDGWKEVHAEKDFEQPRHAQPVEFAVDNVRTDAIRVVGTRLRPEAQGRSNAYMSFLQVEAYDEKGVNAALAGRGGRATASSKTGRAGTHSNDNAWAQACDVGNVIRVSAWRASWNDVEPHEGRYLVPEHWKRALQMARARGALALFPVTARSHLYEGAKARDAFAKYVRATAANLGPSVDGWELHLGDPEKVDRETALDRLHVLATITRAQHPNAAIVIQGASALGARWIENAVASVGGAVGVVLPSSAARAEVGALTGMLRPPALCLAEIDGGADIYDETSGEAAARRFVDLLSATAIPCVTINGEGGLTDYHDNPGAAYYAVRALATALAAGRPGGGDLVELQSDAPGARKVSFLGEGGSLMVALWDEAAADSAGERVLADLKAKGKYSRAVIVDPMTSTVSQAGMAASEGESSVPGVELRPYPVVVRLDA